MPKDKLISFFGKEDTPEFDGVVEYKNPRLFTGNVPSYATHFCTDREDIASIYKKKGVERYDVSSKKSTNEPADTSAPGTESQPKSFNEAGHQRSESFNSTEHVNNGVQEEEEGQQQEEEIDWRELSWPQMRAKAASLSDQPITSKAVAIEVLERHLG